MSSLRYGAYALTIFLFVLGLILIFTAPKVPAAVTEKLDSEQTESLYQSLASSAPSPGSSAKVGVRVQVQRDQVPLSALSSIVDSVDESIGAENGASTPSSRPTASMSDLFRSSSRSSQASRPTPSAVFTAAPTAAPTTSSLSRSVLEPPANLTSTFKTVNTPTFTSQKTSTSLEAPSLPATPRTASLSNIPPFPDFPSQSKSRVSFA